MLELGVFFDLGEDSTVSLLDQLVDYVFYLTIVCVVLGVAGLFFQRSKVLTGLRQL